MGIADAPVRRAGAARAPLLPAVAVTAAALVLRVAAAWGGPLIDDEAYYWLWAQAPQWGYLDHPPLIAALIFLTTRAGDAPLLIRLGPLVLGVLTTCALFLLGRELFGVRAGLIAAGLFQIVPVLAGGGLLATPDAPLFLAWTLALRFLWQGVHGRPRRWLAAGLAVGMGLLGKLLMAFFVAGAALYVLLRARAWLRRPEPYTALLLAGALFSPVVVWNAQHGWAGLRFAADRLGGTSLGLAGVMKLAEEQLPFVLLLLPAFAWALVASLRRRGDERFAFLAWTALPALLLPFLPAYAGAWPHGNWLGPGYLGLCVALAALWNRPIAALAAFNAAVMLYALAATISPVLPLPPGAEEVYGWREAALRVTVEASMEPAGAVVVADRYQVAAQLAYHARTREVLLLPCPPPYGIWPRPDRFEGRSGVALIDARWEPLVRWEQHAATVAEARPLPVAVRGHPLRTFRVFRLRDLHARCP